MRHSDLEILEKWSQDRTEGFHLIYERYASVLLRYVFRFTGNQEHAEEILHDIFSEVLKKEFSKDFHLKPWLFTIAKNKSLNFERQRRHEILCDDAIQKTEALSNQEDAYYEKQISKRLEQIQLSLPDDLARTWELRRQGHDYYEIAEKLRIPLGTVKSRFSRLVDYFRKEFKLD